MCVCRVKSSSWLQIGKLWTPDWRRRHSSLFLHGHNKSLSSGSQVSAAQTGEADALAAPPECLPCVCVSQRACRLRFTCSVWWARSAVPVQSWWDPATSTRRPQSWRTGCSSSTRCSNPALSRWETKRRSTPPSAACRSDRRVTPEMFGSIGWQIASGFFLKLKVKPVILWRYTELLFRPLPEPKPGSFWRCCVVIVGD